MTDLIQRAGDFAEKAHEGQVRKYTGEPYFAHVEAVALMVQADGGDDAQVAAAYLHDVMEDCGVVFLEVRGLFGGDVARLVGELTDQYTNEAYPAWNRERRKAAECGRLGRISDRAKFIKIKDLQDNTTSIVEHDPDFAKVYLREKAAILEAITKETNMGTLDVAEEHIKDQRQEIRDLKERNEYLDSQLILKEEHINNIESADTVEIKGTGTVVKISTEQHRAMINEETTPLQVRVRELESDLAEARGAIDAGFEHNEALHNQIEALTPADDEATPAEAEAALTAAENHRERLEEENAALAATITAQDATISILKNEVHDRKHTEEVTAG